MNNNADRKVYSCAENSTLVLKNDSYNHLEIKSKNVYLFGVMVQGNNKTLKFL